MKDKGFIPLGIKVRKNKRSAILVGFTLIEIMMVLVIIGILAGLITAGAFKAIEDAKKSQAESSIAALQTAIAMYEADVGSYPPGSGSGNSFKTCLQTGASEPATWNGSYMNFTSDELSGNAYVDPWGAPYNYNSGTGINNVGFVDIEDGSSKGINNW